MSKFSNSSIKKLKQCHRLLWELATRVVSKYDCTVVTGHRTEEEQTEKYNEGLSKVQYPHSKHNKYPSLAVDLVPYIKGVGVVWDKEQCYHFNGYVHGVADSMGIKIRSGADWDLDRDISDQSFNDLCHFELLMVEV